MSNMGIQNLAANLSNVARSYLWQIQIPNPIGGGDPNVFLLRCQSTTIPGRSVDVIEIPYMSEASLQYSGKLKYDHTFTGSFIESEDAATFQALYNWAQQVISDVDGIGAGDSNIKTNIYLNLLDSNKNPYSQIVLNGAYLESIANVELSYDGNNAIKFSATWRYDSWNYVPQ